MAIGEAESKKRPDGSDSRVGSGSKRLKIDGLPSVLIPVVSGSELNVCNTSGQQEMTDHSLNNSR